MSGDLAFLSFVNFVKTQLTGSGIAVDLEVGETSPRLTMQDGPDYIRNRWLSARMCQGWLVVNRIESEPLVVTANKALRQVLQATQDPGFIEKYDYYQTPKKLIGSVNVNVHEVSADMSKDVNQSKRVITWELHSNSSG